MDKANFGARYSYMLLSPPSWANPFISLTLSFSSVKVGMLIWWCWELGWINRNTKHLAHSKAHYQLGGRGGNMGKVIDGHRQCPAGNLSNHLMLLMAFRASSQCPGELVLVPSTAQVKLLSHWRRKVCVIPQNSPVFPPLMKIEMPSSRLLCKAERESSQSFKGSTPFASYSGRNRSFPLTTKSNPTSL